jgi:hypothetical protein
VPDQFTVPVDFPDAVEGDLTHCTVGAGVPKEKMVTRSELDLLQRDLNNFPAYAVIIPDQEIAFCICVIPANPIEQFLNRNHTSAAVVHLDALPNFDDRLHFRPA